VIKVTVTRINARSSARQPRSVVVRVPGPQGFKGNTGTSQLGEVVVLNPNQPPAVSQTGTPENAVYNFSLPRTPEFTVRSTTASAPGGDAVAFAEGDSSGDVLFDFTLPRGDEGPQGIQGIQGVKGDKGDTRERGIREIRGILASRVFRVSKVFRGFRVSRGFRASRGFKGNRGTPATRVWRFLRLSRRT
jgi:hypothetical protein